MTIQQPKTTMKEVTPLEANEEIGINRQAVMWLNSGFKSYKVKRCNVCEEKTHHFLVGSKRAYFCNICLHHNSI